MRLSGTGYGSLRPFTGYVASFKLVKTDGGVAASGSRPVVDVASTSTFSLPGSLPPVG